MKLKKFIVAMIAPLALSACTSDNDIISDNDPLPGAGEERFLAVSIFNAHNSGTRADEDATPSDYEKGSENEVNSIRFYFFKANGDPMVITNTKQSYYDCKKEDIVPATGENNENIEKVLDAVVVISANQDENPKEDIKQMVAVVNFEGIKSEFDKINNGNLKLSELQGIIGDEAQCHISDYETKGFLMSSSNYVLDDNTVSNSSPYGLAVQIKETDIKSTRQGAKAEPVSVYVERVAAKVTVSLDFVATPMSVKFNGKDALAIPLKTSGENSENITTELDGKGEQVYVIFNSWDLWWTADKSYLFKKIDTDWKNQANLFTDWNHPAYFRSYWAENPDGIKLANFRHNYANLSFGENSPAYCLENAADPKNNGLKKGYNPASETTNRTLVYLKATLVTVKDGVATPCSYAEWAGNKYTEGTLKTAMFAPSQNIYYVRAEVGESTSVTEGEDGTFIEGNKAYHYWALDDKDVKFVTAQQADKADDKSENSKRYLTYINIDEKAIFAREREYKEGKYKAIDGQFYTKDAEGKFVKVEGNAVETINTDLEYVGGAKLWRDGNTYYYHEIKHLGQTGATDKEVYGIVRNHVYKVEINSVTGLGTPVLSPDQEDGTETWNQYEPIIPQKPDPNAYFLGAQVKILSWRIVPNKVKLEW